ncbi:MAG: divalent metal cation transporter [Desulfobacterales bacterium]
MIFASLVIGETHLALQAYSGALFGMSFLWLVVLVHIVYYPIYEYGSRYAVASGNSLVEGYSKLRFSRPLFWYFLFFMFVTPPLVMGSLVGLIGSVLYSAFPLLTFNSWCSITFLATTALVLIGRYKLIENLSKIILLILVLITLLAFVISPPGAGEFFSGLRPQIPAAAGVWIVIVATLRVPTDPAASIFLSEWAKEKRKEWGDDKAVLVSSMKKSILDIRIGFSLSLFVAIAFMALGAVVFRPRGIVPEGTEFAFKLSEIFTNTFGPWMFPVFILAAFMAFWGGYVSAQDGIHRLFKKIIDSLFSPEEKTRDRIGDLYLIFVAVTGLVMATLLQRPMFMVLLALSMAFLYFPLVVGLNIYCVTRMVDQEFRPGKLNVTLAILGLLLGVTGLVLLVLVRVLKVLN